MANIKVSIIVPVYNTEKYLRQCLDSILEQTLQEIEVICVDDGSTDGSPGILKEFEEKDSRVRIFLEKKNEHRNCQELWFKQSCWRVHWFRRQR